MFLISEVCLHLTIEEWGRVLRTFDFKSFAVFVVIYVGDDATENGDFHSVKQRLQWYKKFS